MCSAPVPTPSTPPLLIFDGDCGFCTTSVNWLKSRLPYFPEAQPWQWIDLDSLGLSEDDVTHYAWVVTSRHQYAGHLAFAAILRMQPSPGLRFLGHLTSTVPFSWVAALGYQLVARNRQRLPGGTPACAMPRS